MKKVFLSFSSRQSDEAKRICNYLESKGVPCFLSDRDLIPGEEYAAQLLDQIDQAAVLVLLLSASSNESPHVLREVEYAVSHRTPILVYSLEPVTLSKSMEYFLMTHQWITSEENKDEKLLQSILYLFENPSGNPTAPQPEAATGKPSRPVLPILCISGLLFFMVICGFLFLFRKSPLESDASLQPSTGISQVKYKVGDTLTFGTYLDAPIEWRVIRLNADNTMILLSKEILSMKAFDAPEGGEYNMYDGVDYWSYENLDVNDDALCVKIRGNNDWELSNIRTWLNSDKEVVEYPDQAPTKKAVGANFYHSEHGFLYDFTDEEKAALVLTELKTPANALRTDAENNMIITKDRVFLLSTDELEWLTEGGISLYAKPSQGCKATDQELYYYNSFTETNHTESYYWWLRNGLDCKSNESAIVTTEAEENITFTSASVGISNYGIRPAVCVDMDKLPEAMPASGR